MITLRILRRRPAASSGADALALYEDRLWRAWSPAQRLAARALMVGAWVPTLAGPPERRQAWRLGLAADEFARAKARFGSAEALEGYVGMLARKGIHRLLNPGAYPPSANPLKNKELFESRARAARLPVPDSLAGGEASAERIRDFVGRHDAVFLKPNYSSKGRGAERFTRRAGGWTGSGRHLSEAGLRRRIESAGPSLIVQQAVATHPALQDLSPDALPTLRLLTCRDETGGFEVTDRLLRMSGASRAPVDNFNRGGLVAVVAADGRVAGPAIGQRGRALVEQAEHPVTGRPIAGFGVAGVGRAEALVLAAHAAIAPHFTVVGWDVGLAVDGPILIEGNWNPGTDILQLAPRVTLGRSRLGALYRHHLARLPPEAWRAAAPIQRERR